MVNWRRLLCLQSFILNTIKCCSYDAEDLSGDHAHQGLVLLCLWHLRWLWHRRRHGLRRMILATTGSAEDAIDKCLNSLVHGRATVVAFTGLATEAFGGDDFARTAVSEG